MAWKRELTLAALNASSENTMVAHLGIIYTRLEEGLLVAEMPVDARTHQPFGLLHGGASAALAETLGSMAGWLMTEEGQCVVGTELNASHHRAVSSGKVRGECRPLHLGTALAEENAMSLACLLHPTPALSGFPHQAAKRLIAELEPFDRQLFGGIVGWCDDEGNGEWVVTIRCARLQQRTLRLFAGAGIVPASSPLGEWRETDVKLTTMLNVFGLN
ncbi:isochorismate synthase [Klebsiella pneumoniae]|nr:isochorismate synthase [Klebsiella pneumoniae]